MRPIHPPEVGQWRQPGLSERSEAPPKASRICSQHLTQKQTKQDDDGSGPARWPAVIWHVCWHVSFRCSEQRKGIGFGSTLMPTNMKKITQKKVIYRCFDFVAFLNAQGHDSRLGMLRQEDVTVPDPDSPILTRMMMNGRAGWLGTLPRRTEYSKGIPLRKFEILHGLTF